MFSKETAWDGMKVIGEVPRRVVSSTVLFEGDTASGDGIFVGCQVGGQTERFAD